MRKGTAKFKDGDRVQMTAAARAANPNHRSHTGTVVGKARTDCEVRVRRDRQKSVVLWHESAWEPLREQPTAPTRKGE